MPATFKIALRVALITSGAILIFWMISQFTIYRYLKTEYYAAIIAVSFLAAGVFIARSHQQQSSHTEQHQLAELTQKELSILTQIAAGKSNKEIASENFVELSTVKTHINNIYSKLGVNNRNAAIKAYSSPGIK
jgi:DNA-binding NarL/FixJ family response regulator